jgi:polar amino acid transport system substrate-binding protein
MSPLCRQASAAAKHRHSLFKLDISGLDDAGAYYLTESTYLVPASSKIKSVTEVDRPGVRVVARSQSTQAVILSRSLKNATLILVGTVQERDDALRSGKADAIASGRPGLANMATKLSGSRILDGSFASASTAVAVPKNRSASTGVCERFHRNSEGIGKRTACDRQAGLMGGTVAPPLPRR